MQHDTENKLEVEYSNTAVASCQTPIFIVLMYIDCRKFTVFPGTCGFIASVPMFVRCAELA
jgi:hypothetical protein